MQSRWESEGVNDDDSGREEVGPLDDLPILHVENAGEMQRALRHEPVEPFVNHDGAGCEGLNDLELDDPIEEALDAVTAPWSTSRM